MAANSIYSTPVRCLTLSVCRYFSANRDIIALGFVTWVGIYEARLIRATLEGKGVQMVEKQNKRQRGGEGS